MVIIHIDYLLSTSISPTDNKARTTDKFPEKHAIESGKSPPGTAITFGSNPQLSINQATSSPLNKYAV